MSSPRWRGDLVVSSMVYGSMVRKGPGGRPVVSHAGGPLNHAMTLRSAVQGVLEAMLWWADAVISNLPWYFIIV